MKICTIEDNRISVLKNEITYTSAFNSSNKICMVGFSDSKIRQILFENIEIIYFQYGPAFEVIWKTCKWRKIAETLNSVYTNEKESFYFIYEDQYLKRIEKKIVEEVHIPIHESFSTNFDLLNFYDIDDCFNRFTSNRKTKIKKIDLVEHSFK